MKTLELMTRRDLEWFSSSSSSSTRFGDAVRDHHY